MTFAHGGARWLESLSRKIACLVALGALAVPAPAYGHSAYLGSTPAAGARVADSPNRIALRFTEPLNARLSRAELRRAGGARVEAAVSADARTMLVTPARRLGTGAYVVKWRSVSTEDGHPLQGTFSFGLRVPAVAATHTIERSPLANGGWARAAARAVLYAALALLSAALALAVLLTRRDGASWLVPPEVASELGPERAGALRERAATLRGEVGTLAVSAAVAVAIIDAGTAAGSFAPAALRDYLFANVAGGARLALGGFVLAAVLTAARRPRLAAALALAALGAVAISGHANSAEPRAAALLNDWVHLAAGSVWLGGIAWMLLVWTPTLRGGGRAARRAAMRHVLPTFGRVALPAFALVVVSGTVSAVIELGEPAALWQTGYGAALTVKVALVAVVAVLSYRQAIRLRPQLLAAKEPPRAEERRHWRLLEAEPAFGAAVIAAAALLVSFPLPPGQAVRADVPAAACDPCPLRTPDRGELGVADLAGFGVVAAWIRRTQRGLAGELRSYDLSGEPSAAPLRRRRGTLASCGIGCWTFTAPPADTLDVERYERGSWHRVALPARWRAGGSGQARALLERAQRTMRALRSVRESERVTSGPGTLAVTHYRVQAPDRLDSATSSGPRRIEIGRRGWLRVGAGPWETSSPLVPFTVKTWFRWTPFAEAAELLDVRIDRGRRVARLALFDPATPVWQRLTVDLSSGRVLSGVAISRAHRITQRYRAFNRPVRINPPQIR